MALDVLKLDKNVSLYGFLQSQSLFYWNAHYKFNILISINLLKKSYRLIYCLWNTDSELVRSISVFLRNLPNDPILFLCNTPHPPIEFRFVFNIFSYSANSIWFEAFIYFSRIQDDDPSLHSTCSFHPYMVFLRTFFHSLTWWIYNLLILTVTTAIDWTK